MSGQHKSIISFSNIAGNSMKDADLVRMANQITTFFEVYPKVEALDGIAKHIHNSWEPRMRNAMKTIVDAGGEGLKPLCIEAMRDYFKGPKSDGRPVIVNPRKLAPDGCEPSFADGGGDG
jgi:formate dehydrogenase subunit delta